MCFDVYIRCLICQFFFTSNYVYFTEQYIVQKVSILQNSILLEYCWNLQNEHFAYPESIENIRLKFSSEKRRDQGWV